MEKIVDPIAAAKGGNVETIEKGLLWHPPFEIENTGNKLTDQLDDGGHFMGAHFMLLVDVALSSKVAVTEKVIFFYITNINTEEHPHLLQRPPQNSA